MRFPSRAFARSTPPVARSRAWADRAPSKGSRVRAITAGGVDTALVQPLPVYLHLIHHAGRDFVPRLIFAVRHVDLPGVHHAVCGRILAQLTQRLMILADFA